MQDLSHHRKSYQKYSLVENDVPSTPNKLFDEWFKLAKSSETVGEANAMTLSTCDSSFQVRSRVVLLKKYSDKGLVFYTNYNSRKGKAIGENPNVCLSFFWPTLERQIIVMGNADRTSAEDSEEYFQSRPRGSQLGAAASEQSKVVNGREFLDSTLDRLTEKFMGKDIPRPEDWGGFVVDPLSFEFWQGRENRMHDRLEYKLVDNLWTISRLSP